MIKKLFSYIIVTLFLGFIVAGIILQTDVVREFIKEELIKKIEEDSDFSVSIGEVKIFPSFQLSASAISLKDHESKILEVDHLYAGFYPIALWRGYLHLHSIHLEGVKFYNVSGSKSAPPGIGFDKIPSKIKIDDFTIDDFTIIDAKEKEKSPPIALRGHLFVDPEEFLVVSSFRIKPKDETKKEIVAEIAYDKGVGTIQIKMEDEIDLHAECIVPQDDMLRINHFHARYLSHSIDGNATLSYDGVFHDSSILFASGEISEIHPDISGQFYGEGSVLGSIWSPELNLILKSDQLKVSEVLLKGVEAKLFSHRTKEGLLGEISIAFTQNALPYRFSGKLFWDETLRTLPTRFTSQTNLAELAEFFDIATTDIAGDVKIEILFSDKNLHSRITLTDGRMENYELGSQITDIQAVAEGTLERLELKSLSASDGAQGKYSLTGSIDLDIDNRFPFDFLLKIDRAELVQLDDVRGTASGVLHLHGDREKGHVEGAITVNSSRLTIPEKTSAVADSIQILYINQDPQEALPTSNKVSRPDLPVDFNVKLLFPGRTKIKGQGFTTDWKGEVVITGTPLSPKVNGELTIVNGKYKVRGRTVAINRGTMTFAGDVEKKTSVYVIGELDVDRYKIEIIVKGPIRNPTTSFRSNPPLSRKEILSWVLFNKNISDISEFQGGKLNDSIMTLSSSVDNGPDFFTRFGDALGLDRVDISGSPDASQVSFELGKYLSEKTYISISRKPTRTFESTRIGTGTLDPNEFDQSNRIGIETSLGKYFKLQAEVDEDQAGQINLLWKRDY